MVKMKMSKRTVMITKIATSPIISNPILKSLQFTKALTESRLMTCSIALKRSISRALS